MLYFTLHIFKCVEHITGGSVGSPNVGGLHCSVMDSYLNSHEQHRPGSLWKNTDDFSTEPALHEEKLGYILA